uniref:Coiled-coil domain containing 120a n=1 Tax=Sander lucioperca TaxID=283035 RepID=A0A8C9X3K4_SANLU
HDVSLSLSWAGQILWAVKAEKGEVTFPLMTKQRDRMAELLERRRGLQALLSTRLAELRRVCLQEAELTGAVPSDFPLEAGEKPPCVRRRAGASRHGNRKCREEDSQRSKQKKTLFSGALRKHSDSEHNTHHGKRTVHRGCHTDDTVRSESSSTSDSTGLDNGNTQTDHPETLQTHKPLPLHPPPRSQDSSSSVPSDPGPAGEGGLRANAARHSNSSDGLLEGTNTSGAFRSSETLADGRTRTRANNGRTAGYSEVLLDYVWGKQQQLQRQQSQPNNRQPITSHHQLLYNGFSSQQPQGAPPTYRGPSGDQRRVKVTRTKSCGPFLPVQPSQTDTHNPPLSAIQPDPHPYLLPPRPPQPAPVQDAQLEDATRSLHKALALEGKHQPLPTRDAPIDRPLTGIVNTKANGGVKGQAGGGGALHGRRRTHGGIQQATYQTETSHHKKTLPHSATFHGHPLHGR